MKKIQLTKFKFAIVDDGDFDFFDRLGLFLTVDGSVEIRLENSKKTFSIPATKLLLKLSGRIVAIHKNGNKLDLRKKNLITADESQLNHGIRLNYKKTLKSSVFRGVSRTKSGTWKAQIMHHKKRFVKNFITEKEAAIWYNQKAESLYGDWAYQNKI